MAAALPNDTELMNRTLSSSKSNPEKRESTLSNGTGVSKADEALKDRKEEENVPTYEAGSGPSTVGPEKPITTTTNGVASTDFAPPPTHSSTHTGGATKDGSGSMKSAHFETPLQSPQGESTNVGAVTGEKVSDSPAHSRSATGATSVGNGTAATQSTVAGVGGTTGTGSVVTEKDGRLSYDKKKVKQEMKEVKKYDKQLSLEAKGDEKALKMAMKEADKSTKVETEGC
ncbi:hypothetical protein BT69DRAFT_752281 [Atractiella rhizophila]|nr:hypothetical protein BT69DRAFT_752281 [Atractiella rhizophila]